MKRLTLLVMPLMAVSLLTNCGERNDYLCFTAKEDNSSVYYGVNGLSLDIHIQKSTDGKRWEDWKIEEIVKLNTNEKIYVRNTKKTLSRDATNCFAFGTEGKIAASGNVMSMIDFGELYTGCFCMLFYDSNGLVTPPELPATKLAQGCYYEMFDQCDNLVVTPTLPATTLAENCYDNMFSYCISLTNAPELPATTLADGCYSSMFSGCTSLTTTPSLPATTLANNCYNNMFSGCTSLTTTPSLPATTLANNCYSNMFSGCTSLTSAPNLPATTLVHDCYSSMFYGCESLKVSDSEGTKFFTCPNDLEEKPIHYANNMFTLTGGDFKKTPTAGSTYYWY